MHNKEFEVAIGDVYVFRGVFAKTHRARRKGLAKIEFEEAPIEMVFENCRSIHTFGMRFDLQLVFLDQDNKIVGKKIAKPNRIIFAPRSTFSIVEIPLPVKG